jgi:hypothetical protein
LEDIFLQKPDTSGTVDLNQVYSSTRNAEAALFRCYRDVLRHGWPGANGMDHGTLGALSGELCRGTGAWQASWNINNAGLMPITQRGNSSGCAGADNFNQNWEYIRACFLVKENIDRVPDMDDTRKGHIKGEATGLIAYRYMGMFYRYGGIPIVRKSFLPDDDLSISRATLEETLEYTLELMDEAYEALPHAWDANSKGRLTKGAILAMKARLLMFAARPLFNSATPYLDFDDRANNNLVCFGNADPNRWQAAITANEAVLTWAAANDYKLIKTAPAGQRNTFADAATDYGTATSVMNNQEVLLAYKVNESATTGIVAYYNYSGNRTDGGRSDIVQYGMTNNFLQNYRDRDGGEIDWPKVGEPAPRPFSNFLENIDQMEARFRMDVCVQTRGSMNNTHNSWSSSWGWRMVNFELNSNPTSNVFPGIAQSGFGSCGPPTKFYYGAGTRLWFEPPLFRLAETYLNLAEAYNEANNPAKALENLNVIRHRAGLPTATETNKEQLRRLIWREKAVEYFFENHRYFDAKHWKHPDIATDLHGGPKREFQFHATSNSQQVSAMHGGYWSTVTYTSYWHPKMFLEPFHQDEVNKGFIIQNPGY